MLIRKNQKPNCNGTKFFDMTSAMQHNCKIDLPSTVWIHPSFGLFTNCLVSSVTRFGDLLDFGQVFKAFGKN